MARKRAYEAQASCAEMPAKSFGGQDLNQKIKDVAQRLYEKRGRTPGHELDDWLEAEKIVKRECNCR